MKCLIILGPGAEEIEKMLNFALSIEDFDLVWEICETISKTNPELEFKVLSEIFDVVATMNDLALMQEAVKRLDRYHKNQLMIHSIIESAVKSREINSKHFLLN